MSVINLGSLTLNIPDVSPFQFILTIGVLGMFIFFFGLYMAIFVWKFGEPLRKYLFVRMRPKHGIIQEYELESVNLHDAYVDNGEFTDLEHPTHFTIEQVPKPWYAFWIRTATVDKQVYHHPKPLISKSTVSINGVDTLLAWNVNPRLPLHYRQALISLTKIGYNNTQDINDDITGGLIKLVDIIPDTKLTYEAFFTLHEKVKNRNSISVTADDVLEFETKYLDEHPRKSIVEKIVAKEQHRIFDKKYQTYAFYIIGLMVLGGFVMLAWKIYNKGNGGT